MMPSGRHADKRYLLCTVDDTYPMYVKWCKENGKKAMSKRTFCKGKPSNVYHLSKTPDSECMYEKCQHIQLIKLQLLKSKV